MVEGRGAKKATVAGVVANQKQPNNTGGGE
jgi:hypothetical protein